MCSLDISQYQETGADLCCVATKLGVFELACWILLLCGRDCLLRHSLGDSPFNCYGLARRILKSFAVSVVLPQSLRPQEMRLAAAMRRGRAGASGFRLRATPVVVALAAGTLLSRSFIGSQPSDRSSRVSRAFFGGLFGSPQGSPTPIKDAPQENARHYLTGGQMYPPWPAGMKEAMFGMGCFWCSENIFMRVQGVYSTQVGYAGGGIENPTYLDVCTGATNHNEVVRVVYDPEKVSYVELLQKFWEKHDPTTLNQQGNDFGTQYRSGIYYYSEEQRLLAEEGLPTWTKARYQEAIKKANAAWGRSISTEIEPAPTFYYAESFHQQYDAKPGNRDYYEEDRCMRSELIAATDNLQKTCNDQPTSSETWHSMASWLTGRVASLVKEPRQALPAADEAQQTLEQRARALTSPHSAAWLLSHWLEQCNSSEVYVQCQAQGGPSGSQGARAWAWQLSFQQVLLRSSAFELVLEVCAKVPSVREALTPGPAAASALLEQSKSLRQALHGMAERLLLPGALEVWPSLFDALLSRDSAGALPWDSWARRLVAALKKPWRLESLWPQLRRWDTAAAEELGGSDTASSTTLKATGAQGLSKQGIRAELIRRRIPQLAVEAGRLRSRSEALCDGLEALRAVDGMGAVSCKEIEQLIQDASLALDSLDSGVQGSRDEARQLGQALSDAGSAVQRQMATVMLTQETFVARRGQLQNEKEQLAKRMQELDAEVTQLDQEASRCNQQIRQLQAQFSHNTSHYDGLLGGSAAFSEELGDRKAKA
eukprot:s7905_g1.t1